MGQALGRWRPGRTVRRLLWQGGVSALFVALAFRAFDLGGLRDAIESADLRWAPPALLLFTTAKYVDSWRWRYLLRGVRPLPQRALFGAFLIGNMVNNLLPLRAGDVAKVQVLGLRYGAPRASLAASVFVVEATLDGVVFLLFLAVSLVFFDLGATGASFSSWHWHSAGSSRQRTIQHGRSVGSPSFVVLIYGGVFAGRVLLVVSGWCSG